MPVAQFKLNVAKWSIDLIRSGGCRVGSGHMRHQCGMRAHPDQLEFFGVTLGQVALNYVSLWNCEASPPEGLLSSRMVSERLLVYRFSAVLAGHSHHSIRCKMMLHGPYVDVHPGVCT
jgi:hypothetical protein